MKSFLLMIMLLGFFAIMLGVALYAQIRISDNPMAAPKPAQITPTSTTATGTMFIPPDFQGPTADPQIIGPSSNPPNH